jgi:quinol monooxygenase YgiN/mannose-6-phosphate isomerase-like protein (cupin superfamily)
MPSLARYARMVAKPGQGDALAAKMLDVAATLTEAPGCLQYLINRQEGEPDVVWVTELWRSQDDIDAALKAAGGSELMPAVLALLDTGKGDRIDLEPVGGVGFPGAADGSTVVNLDEVEDMAARFGFGETGEARFARGPLAAAHTGVSLQRLRPGARQSFGHRHHIDEEIYVVLTGAGRVALGDEVTPVKQLDAIRVAPGTPRAFEAGPDGLELLAFGTHHAGDPEMLPGWWPQDGAGGADA